jgi:uncharacterized membrane protein YeaQ/YmgE (transglycosylase-associated protein family)
VARVALPYTRAVEPHHVIVWLFIGLVAGVLASRVVIGHSLGCLVNTAVGLAGAIIAGAVLNAIAPNRPADVAGIFGDIAISFAGAAVLLALIRVLTPRRSRLGRPGPPPMRRR